VKRGPVTARILELLSEEDRTWVLLVTECEHLVPPGQAHRKAEQNRLSNLRYRSKGIVTLETSPRRRNLDNHEIETAGARMLVGERLSRLHKHKRIRYYHDTCGERWVTLAAEDAIRETFAALSSA